ncbi:inactive pancreatic lipase-related protein 1 [Caerostris extrusa]|uniref:Inactive pancreatic lipase-related protein 1 n=1 Tax=Caerostris extrusa TaxID=172846 RepID=A0AAV4QNZ3_CAEEX|nr:inactive pancreatic lipase-related protein 1 [Caerostris extrusa]
MLSLFCLETLIRPFNIFSTPQITPKNLATWNRTQDALERCPFNSSYPMKFLIYGFDIVLTPDNQFLMMKDQMLSLYDYNVIVVNWTNFNQPPYLLAALNAVLVGRQVANLIKYLEANKGVDPQNVHLIGHSLGAHLAGTAGKNTPNLGRITGLDPAAPLFGPLTIFHRLTYTDAIFVDVIHSNNLTYGYGTYEPHGDIDFYPNGGAKQPQCQSVENSVSCNHNAAPQFFLQSINTTKCLFRSVQCTHYKDFLDGQCPPNSSTTDLMGLPAQQIPGLAPKSKFYLRTMEDSPYCLQRWR